MTIRLIYPGLLVLAATFAACSPSGDTQAPGSDTQQQAPASPAVATMGGVSLSQSEAQSMLDAMPVAQRRILTGDRARLEASLRGEVLRRYVLAQARKEGWMKRPDVAALLEQAGAQVVFQAYLASRAQVEPGFPGDALVQQVYEKNKGSFLQSGRVHLSQIFRASGEDGGEAARGAIETAHQRLQAGEDFADVARELSQHQPSAPAGGDLGWVQLDQLQPAIREAITGQETGSLIGPVASAAGWHLLQLHATEPASYLALETVRPRIEQLLRTEKAKQLQNAYVSNLINQHKVTLQLGAFAATVEQLLADAQPQQQVLASMGSETLGVSELQQDLRQLGKPALKNLLQQRDRVTQMLSMAVLRKFVVAQARAEGFADRADLQQAIARAKDRVAYVSYVRAQVVPPADYPDSQTLARTYAQLEPRPMRDEVLHLTQLSVAAADEADKTLASLAEDLKKAKNLEALAEQREQSLRKLTVPVAKLLPAVREALQEAEAGQVVGPLPLPSGVALLRLDEREASRPLTLEELKPLLSRKLRQLQAQQNEKAYLSRLVQQSPIQLMSGPVEKLLGS